MIGRHKNLVRRAVDLVVLVGAIAFAIPIHADIVFYRNQRYVKGKVIGQSINTIRFRKTDGTVLNIPKKKIRKIIYINESRQSELNRAAEAKRIEARRRAATAARKRAEEVRRKQEAERVREAARRKQEAERLAVLRRKAQENTRKESRERRERKLGGLWRSALLPGWGQYYQDRKKRATFFFAGFAGGGLVSYYYRSRFNTFQKDHDFAVNRTILQTPALAPGSADIFLLARNIADARGSRKRLERASLRSNTMLTFLFGLYVWNLIDVYYFDLSPDSYISIRTRPGRIALGYHFNY